MAAKKGNTHGKQFKPNNTAAEKWTEDEAVKLGTDLILWLNEKDEDGEDKGNMIYEEFLVIERGLYPHLISYLSGKFKSFFQLIELAKKIQEIKLHKYGLADRLNAAMAKFSLTVNHGWIDSSKIDHTTKGDKIQHMTPIEFFNNGDKDK